eukprot:8576480-Ditylum_brightwellii.AAC.1
MERNKQNKYVDDNNGDGVDGSDNGGGKHLTYLSQAVDCHLMERSEQNTCVDGNNEDGVDNSDDNSYDGGDKHLTHLSQA